MEINIPSNVRRELYTLLDPRSNTLTRTKSAPNAVNGGVLKRMKSKLKVSESMRNLPTC